MKGFGIAVALILISGLAIFVVIGYRSQRKLAEENQVARRQLEELTVENERLSNALAQADIGVALPESQTNELLRLRNEVATLRTQVNRAEGSHDPRIDEVEIVSARYGSGTNVVNVTARVIELLHRESGGFTARADWMQIDPAPYRNKTLTIVYNYGGKQNIYTAAGGEKVRYDLLTANASR